MYPPRTPKDGGIHTKTRMVLLWPTTLGLLHSHFQLCKDSLLACTCSKHNREYRLQTVVMEKAGRNIRELEINYLIKSRGKKDKRQVERKEDVGTF